MEEKFTKGNVSRRRVRRAATSQLGSAKLAVEIAANKKRPAAVAVGRLAMLAFVRLRFRTA